MCHTHGLQMGCGCCQRGQQAPIAPMAGHTITLDSGDLIRPGSHHYRCYWGLQGDNLAASSGGGAEEERERERIFG